MTLDRPTVGPSITIFTQLYVTEKQEPRAVRSGIPTKPIVEKERFKERSYARLSLVGSSL